MTEDSNPWKTENKYDNTLWLPSLLPWESFGGWHGEAGGKSDTLVHLMIWGDTPKESREGRVGRIPRHEY